MHKQRVTSRDPTRQRFEVTGRQPGDDLFCGKPFEHLEVSFAGRAYLCCPTWLPEPVGDLTKEHPLALWNGEAAQRIRESILDGSFRYCTGCPFLSSRAATIIPRAEVTEASHLAIIREKRVVMERIRCLNLAYDRSCNLTCPTCRTARIMASGIALRGLRAYQSVVVTPQVLRILDSLYLTGSGDPFASRLFRELLFSLDATRFPALRILLHTNALLFTPTNWQKMAGAQSLVHSVEVSVDAATAETYAINRRGGNWGRLLSNLAFIGRLRRNGPIQHLRLSFVVQANNWREMGSFVRLAGAYGADVVQFTALTNWRTFDADEFARRAVHLPQHHENAEFLHSLAVDTDLRDERVLSEDFGRFVARAP